MANMTTFIMLEKISKLKNNENTINILLVNKRNIKCKKKDLGYYELSSKNKIDHYSICGRTITNNKPIILYNNKKRKDIIIKMIDWYFNYTKYSINVWIDEKDKGFSNIKKDIIPLLNKKKLINIYLLTAHI